LSAGLPHDTVTPDVETSSEAYGRRFEGPAGRFLLEAQARAADRLLDRFEDRPLRVLDVGGGHGQLAPLFLERGWDVTVQCSAPSCARLIRPLAERYPGQVRFVTSPLLSLPFGDRSFDLVCAVRVLSHLERWRDLLEEMARVSRSHLLVDYASRAGFNVLTPLLFRLKRRIEGDTRPYFCHTATPLARHLRALGYGRIRVRKELFMPMGAHRLLGRAGISAAAEALFRITGLTDLIGSPVILLAERSAALCEVWEPSDAPARQVP
jgi:ubiquinone/menaquinone biosynthesis C-methylase UbiE